jgi:hypothetical protein
MYPEREGFLWASPAHLLVAEGKQFSSKPLSVDQEEFLDVLIEEAGGIESFHTKECFYNAQRLALTDWSGRIQYLEGYGMNLIPCHHAWAVLDNEVVVDLTWRRDLQKTTGLPNRYVADIEGVEYVGVVFGPQDIEDMWHTHEMSYAFLDFPILRDVLTGKIRLEEF